MGGGRRGRGGGGGEGGGGMKKRRKWTEGVLNIPGGECRGINDAVRGKWK